MNLEIDFFYLPLTTKKKKNLLIIEVQFSILKIVEHFELYIFRKSKNFKNLNSVVFLIIKCTIVKFSF